MPVGSGLLGKAYSTEPFRGFEPDGKFQVGWAPFSGEERAAIILTANIGLTMVEAFGLVELVPAWGAAEWRPAAVHLGDAVSSPLPGQSPAMYLGEATGADGDLVAFHRFHKQPLLMIYRDIRFRVTGDVADSRVQSHVRTLKSWWRSYIDGQRSGRPPGTGVFADGDDLLRRLRSASPTPLTQEAACEQLQCQLKTLRDNYKRFGFQNWAEIRARAWD